MKPVIRDRVCGFVFLVVGLIMLYLSIFHVNPTGTDLLGEQFVPYLCSGAVLIFSIVLIAKSYSHAALAALATQEAPESRKADYIRVYAYFAVVLVAVTIMNFTSFIPGALLIVLGNLFLQGKQVPKWWYPLVLAICAVIYCFFVFGISVDLP